MNGSKFQFSMKLLLILIILGVTIRDCMLTKEHRAKQRLRRCNPGCPLNFDWKCGRYALMDMWFSNQCTLDFWMCRLRYLKQIPIEKCFALIHFPGG